jgi:hypothetical protein
MNVVIGRSVFEDKIERACNVDRLTAVVAEMAASFGEPVPDKCWYEASLEAAERDQAFYSLLLFHAAKRFEKIVEWR